MTKLLVKLQVKEVSLVDKAANKRKFLILKNEESNMPKELTLDVRNEDTVKIIKELVEDSGKLELLTDIQKSELKDLLQEIAKTKDSKEALELINKMEVSDRAKNAVKSAVRALNAVKEELPEDMLKILSGLSGLKMPEEKAKEEDPKEEDMPVKKEVKKEDGAMAPEKKEPIMKEDGSVNLEAVPEELRPVFKSLIDTNKEAVSKADKLESDLNKERDDRMKAVYIQKASELENLSIKPEVFGVILKKMSESLTPEEFSEVDRVLKAANEAASALFKSTGSDGENEDKDKTAYEELEGIAEVIAKERKITKEAAFVAALDENPELAAKERNER